jgi:hypothetical protein
MARENKGLRGIFKFIYFNWGSKIGHLPLKRKGGHIASISNCKLTKNYVKNPM